MIKPSGDAPHPAIKIAYALILSVAGAGNIWVNHVGKGSTWDLYPIAQCFWVVCSFLVAGLVGRTRSLLPVVIALLLLDSFVDLCAMGHPCWWAGPPVLVEWKWDALRDSGRIYPMLYAYWGCTWAVQVPWRCVAMARMIAGGWGKPFVLVALGLNIIWATCPQDVMFYFVWLGRYDANEPYFSYLPPEGFWNLWNMLLLRVPIGVGVGAWIVRAGLRRIGRASTHLQTRFTHSAINPV